MLRPFAIILTFSLFSSFCAGGESLEVPSAPNQVVSDDDEPPFEAPLEANLQSEANLEDQNDSPEAQPVKARETLDKVCDGFAKKSLHPIKISGSESVVKLRGNSGLHLKVLAQEERVVVRIVGSSLQKNLAHLCISLAENVTDFTLLVDTNIQDMIVKTPDNQAKVEIDTGDRGLLAKLRSESTGDRPQFFLKGAGVRPCEVPSDDYFCE